MKQLKLLTENRAKFTELLRPAAHTDCFLGDFGLKKGVLQRSGEPDFCNTPFVSFITATVLLLTQEQLNRAALNYV